MRTKDEMKQILDELEEKLAFSTDWEPQALDLLDEFCDELKVWVHDGYIAHDDLENNE